MHFDLIAIGTKMPSWVQEGFSEYAQRLPREHALRLIEIPAGKRSKSADISRLMAKESQEMLKMIPAQNFVVALDERGHSCSTEKLAQYLESWRTQGMNISFLIGGPEGLGQACKDRANLMLSLSPFTFPHPLVRIILAEQLYRAWTILIDHPYHRV